MIDAEGALMRVGIGIGVRTWCQLRVSQSNFPFGVTVANNVLEVPHRGWGIAVRGVRGVVVTGNVDRASHIGRPWPMPNDWCDLSAGDPPLSRLPHQPRSRLTPITPSAASCNPSSCRGSSTAYCPPA